LKNKFEKLSKNTYLRLCGIFVNMHFMLS